MFDKLNQIITILKGISVIVFFCTLSYGTIQIIGSVSRIESNLNALTGQITKEIPQVRSDLFGTLSDAITKTNNRLYSIETNLFKRIDSIESKTFVELEKTNTNVQTISESIVSLANEYSKIPGEVQKISSSIRPNIDCEINDYCWPNLFSDLLIDSRNMFRDGTKTFALVNKEVPRFTQEVSKVSTSLSVEIPKITENSTKITDNIQRLTKPKWYDRAIGWGVNGSLVWFNINRSR
jgi:uncharacterized phage infection (PIP) family protein YhgE